MKRTAQTISIRIKALQKFLSKHSELVQTDGLFIQNPTAKETQDQYVKLSWELFTKHMIEQVSVEMHKQSESAFVIGAGTYVNDDGTTAEFIGCKFRDPEFAYMIGLNPETLTAIESPVDTVKAVSRHSSKER